MIYGEDSEWADELKAETLRWKLLFIAALAKYAMESGNPAFARCIAEVMGLTESDWFEVFGEHALLGEELERALVALEQEYRHD